MSDPALGLLMLALIVVVIMMGFATAFTLMGLGMFFGFIAFYDPSQHWTHNRVFDLMVQRTYGAMTNDVLISIPLFVLMGYVMERGALVDKMFYSIQLAFRRVPASLAVATLIVCTFWGIASGLVGAVVVLMGVIAFNPMLRAGYDVKLASGVITAGGTLGILIPPSVMIIVYAAVAGQSVVKLYAAAMFPGFFLAFLYLVYVIGWAMINPKIAPPLPEEQTRVKVPAWITQVRDAVFAQHVRRLAQGAGVAGAGEGPGDRRQADDLWGGGEEFHHRAGAVPDHRHHAGDRVVVRRDPSAGRRGLRTGRGPAATRQRGGDAGGDARRKRSGLPVLSLVRDQRRRVAAVERAFLLAHERRALRGAQALDVVGDAARHPDRDRSRGDPVRHHDRDGSRRRSARPAPSSWRSMPARSTGSAPRKRCS